VAAGRANDAAARRAVDFLLETQQEDGGWRETQFVHYDAASGHWFGSELHAAAEALSALSHWAIAATANQTGEKNPVALRLVGTMADE
jgi:hypothetical protein